MGSIRGRYEWDDDELTPGRKREGGLRQNLFDRDGKLKANARFIPVEDEEPLVITGPPTCRAGSAGLAHGWS